MNNIEASRKLQTLPWQALYNFAVKHEIPEDEIKGKEKSEIISRLLALNIPESEIETIVDDYIYGTRVTFTLWNFSKPLEAEDIAILKSLEEAKEDWISVDGFRNLHFLSITDCQNRLEILYLYSKEYSYIDEEGKANSIWELHRGCLWIGTEHNYLASISKHEKMTICLIEILSRKLDNIIVQIKPPKKAIERCANMRARSRIVLQGANGEKTAISNSSGFTDEQEKERERLHDRFDTSGSYIANISDKTNATIKYNVTKGNIGVYKHLSSSELFEWSGKAIGIILEEIENLKGKPAIEIFGELGIEIKWPGFSDYKEELDWFLTQAITASDYDKEFRITIPPLIKKCLPLDQLFITIPRVYCRECDSFEIPYCLNCGEPLSYSKKGILECSCDAPLKITCREMHKTCEIKPWYLAKNKMIELVKSNLLKAFPHKSFDLIMCVLGDELYVLRMDTNENADAEIMFSDISCFQSDYTPDRKTRNFAVRLNEKCNGGTCTYKKIDECVKDGALVCLPKVFYGILPSYRPQPHNGNEFGDVSGPIQVGNASYRMIGIIKRNSNNKTGGNARRRTDQELIEDPLRSTSDAGEEIIRQFVEQGMVDSRVDVIAVVAPQYFDQGLKGTLCMLAKFGGKKVVFIELDQICQLIDMNNSITVQ